MNSKPIERHPLTPFLPEKARLLMLGSFPPPRKRWSMDFFYPNLNNDMWRIFGLIFFNERNYFLTEKLKSFDQNKIIRFLEQTGIAVYDTALAVRRLQDNASDKFLEIIEATPIGELLEKLPACEAIVTTGQKATDLVREQMQTDSPSIGEYKNVTYLGRDIRFYRMPSSSRAYPLSLERKAAFYQNVFHDLNMLNFHKPNDTEFC